ncbi:AAA family ATPase [endosymbiont of Lamellibrachia barhami]|uniref:AAA family ATPase n=1 Tax=endosymbiont of Lamellibrachia barhami TaxID=205975 RepID=UPI0015B28E68|nr:ATP-binding protein [endosymbiont of Lamellibrachia barhami]
MITKFKIDNFKSLVGFECDLAKFTCLIGLNGAGKSTILQAMDFLSQLMAGDLSLWLDQRGWEKADLKSKFTTKSNIDFEVVIEDKEWGEITWSGSINRAKLNCTRESVRVGQRNLLNVVEGHYTIAHLTGESSRETTHPIVFEYQGSILSQLKGSQIPAPLRAIRQQMLEMKSLDLLSPAALRKKSRASGKDLGLGGERLSAFIHELDSDNKDKLLDHLQRLYPSLSLVSTSSLRSGWKELSVIEQYGDKKITTEARHINDGLLRVMAIAAQIQTEHNFLLFDEIENGINPELVEILVNWLVDAPQQVMVTTHSPMILNYLEDTVATQGVLLVYKTPQGHTQAIPFFQIPGMAEKLNAMGPGEVFVDTDLVTLVSQINTKPAKG